MLLTKASLAIRLSRLRVFDSANLRREQYPTDSEIAADILWKAYLLGDLSCRTAADLGCGTGILGIGLLLLGVKRVHMIDSDEKALTIARENLTGVKSEGSYDLIHADIASFDRKVDLVVQNPPFGTKVRGADRAFLEKAFTLADVVYSFHKSSTAPFVKSMGSKHSFPVTHQWDYDFPLKHSHSFHRRNIHRVAVSAFRFVREK
ncbi:TPA: methyltransferase [Candidatus Woesearchaeota archaeon]|nr:methyltransferase [Candidatus Woesearchaeota archaeon]